MSAGNEKVSKAIDATGFTQPQFDPKFVGNAGQNMFIGEHKVYFQGSTGLVATQRGIPGVTVGRLATGQYGIRFPRWKEVSIDACIYTPTGVQYISNVRGMSGVGFIEGVSGGALLELSKYDVTPAATTLTVNPSAYKSPQNPVTGTMVALRFFVNPVTAY